MRHTCPHVSLTVTTSVTLSTSSSAEHGGYAGGTASGTAGSHALRTSRRVFVLSTAVATRASAQTVTCQRKTRRVSVKNAKYWFRCLLLPLRTWLRTQRV